MGGQYFLLSTLCVALAVDILLLIDEWKRKVYKVELTGKDLYVYRILEPQQSIHSLIYDCLLALGEVTDLRGHDKVTLYRRTMGKWVKVGTFQVCNF